MKLTITDPIIPKTSPKDQCIVEITTMQGDADGYRHFTVGPFSKGEEEASLLSLLETLNRMTTQFSYDTGYEFVLGFEQWFGECNNIGELEEYFPNLLAKYGEEAHQVIYDLCSGFTEEWHKDPRGNGNHPEQLDKFRVVYYDNSGSKFNVEIDWEN